MTPIAFQGQGSKVEVTCLTLFSNIINKKKTESFGLGLSNLEQILVKAQVRHTLQPLCDLSATKIQNDRRGRRGVATRFCSWSPTRRRLVGDLSGTGCRLIGDWSATSWGPLCDLMQLVAERSGTGPRLVADQSPIGLRPSQLKTVIKEKNIDNIF